MCAFDRFIIQYCRFCSARLRARGATPGASKATGRSCSWCSHQLAVDETRAARDARIDDIVTAEASCESDVVFSLQPDQMLHSCRAASAGGCKGGKVGCLGSNGKRCRGFPKEYARATSIGKDGLQRVLNSHLRHQGAQTCCAVCLCPCGDNICPNGQGCVPRPHTRAKLNMRRTSPTRSLLRPRSK